EQLPLRFDIVKKTLGGVRAAQITEGHVIALDRIIGPLLAPQRGGIGEQRLRIKALAYEIGDAREFQVVPQRLVESLPGSVESPGAWLKVGHRQRRAAARRDDDRSDLFAQIIL